MSFLPSARLPHSGLLNTAQATEIWSVLPHLMEASNIEADKPDKTGALENIYSRPQRKYTTGGYRFFLTPSLNYAFLLMFRSTKEYLNG